MCVILSYLNQRWCEFAGHVLVTVLIVAWLAVLRSAQTDFLLNCRASQAAVSARLLRSLQSKVISRGERPHRCRKLISKIFLHFPPESESSMELLVLLFVEIITYSGCIYVCKRDGFSLIFPKNFRTKFYTNLPINIRVDCKYPPGRRYALLNAHSTILTVRSKLLSEASLAIGKLRASL